MQSDRLQIQTAIEVDRSDDVSLIEDAVKPQAKQRGFRHELTVR